jgi:RNA polymerase sigma-70 factor (ECF subfamily)
VDAAVIADADLAQAAAQGDAESFDSLVERHASRLHRWLVSTGTGHHDAEDAVQEAFIRAHRAIASYNPKWAFTTWIFTIAHRVRLDMAARRRDHAPLHDEHPASAAEPEPDPLPAGGLWARAQAVLPADDYRILWLHYAEDQPPAAVAMVLGITGIAARVRLHRARKRLEASLRADPDPRFAEAMS